MALNPVSALEPQRHSRSNAVAALQLFCSRSRFSRPSIPDSPGLAQELSCAKAGCAAASRIERIRKPK